MSRELLKESLFWLEKIYNCTDKRLLEKIKAELAKPEPVGVGFWNKRTGELRCAISGTSEEINLDDWLSVCTSQTRQQLESELLEALDGIRELMGIDWLLPEFDEARETLARARGDL